MGHLAGDLLIPPRPTSGPLVSPSFLFGNDDDDDVDRGFERARPGNTDPINASLSVVVVVVVSFCPSVSQPPFIVVSSRAGGRQQTALRVTDGRCECDSLRLSDLQDVAGTRC